MENLQKLTLLTRLIRSEWMINFGLRTRILIIVLFLLASIVALRWVDKARWWPGKDELVDWACSSPRPTPSLKGFISDAPLVTKPSQQCPDFFKWIHEDLRPWKETGITREMVEKGRPSVHFRVVIIAGLVYVETFARCYQTRDVFTQWGILQLLSRFPGQIPDLELLFNCEDLPMTVRPSNSSAPRPAALFQYCGSDSTAVIVFPDWSFWGWAEVNIRPWGRLAMEMKAANQRKRWRDREPYAFWKGNPSVDPRRQDLLKCNVTDREDWSARLYVQDWAAESKARFKGSDLVAQCTHQYKIYIDGRTWSVSRKYILACNSPVLVVEPHYYDFFSRGLSPLRHFWPVRADDKCPAIKYAVEWGRCHQTEVQEIGKKGSSFMFEEVSMDRVYDYMLHSLTEYARLLKFKPVVPAAAVELTRERIMSQSDELGRKFMQESEVKSSAVAQPCSQPPPMKPEEMNLLLAERVYATRLVESWEKQSF
ncbi:uncharacterized protein LOC144708022 [Wolffia australiana]